MVSRDDLLHAFQVQVDWCVRLGSPFTACILKSFRSDLEASGPAATLPAATLLDGWSEEPVGAALALRVAGGFHALVRSGAAPALARYYPGHGAAPIDGGFDAAVRGTLTDHHEFLREFLTHPVQTNEAARSGALLGGFLEIAKRLGRPLALYEIGSSAGLNLLWDRFRYDLSGMTWGDPASPITIPVQWRGDRPALEQRPEVISRVGCDIRPIDIHDDMQVERALAYIWPDQSERLQRLTDGIAMARAMDVRIAQDSADTWLGRVLKDTPAGATPVLFHSIMWQYMPIDVQKAVRTVIDAAGARAGVEGFAWLRMEPPTPRDIPEVRLTLWPEGRTWRLAYTHPHAKDLEWGVVEIGG